MGDKELKQLARDSIEAFNRADWNRWNELHAPNVVYEEIATERRMTGRDEILVGLKGWRQAFPDLKGTITNLIVRDDQALLEVEWEGTHKGELKTPFGVVPPSGKRNITKSVLVLKMEKDLIVSDRHYFDFFSMLRKIGALPEKFAKAAGA